MNAYVPGVEAPKGWTAPCAPDGWTALASLNLNDASARQFNETVNIFNEKAKLLPKPDLHLPDGWHFITPYVAEQLLIANAHNRIPTFGNVRYIGEQIDEDDWQKTGEPIIIRPNGSLANGQHRCWAGYFIGKGFWTYIVNIQDDVPNLFAYIDNGKTRTVGDSLHIAGFNGQSATIGRAVEIVRHYDAGAYRADSWSKLAPRMSNIKVMRFVEQNPKIVTAAHLMAGEHGDANSIIGYADVAVFFTFRVLELHGEEVVEEFMSALEAQEPEDATAPAVFQILMEADHAKDKKRMKRFQVLGTLIKTFNAWLSGERVSKKDIALRVNEDFPAFELPDEPVSEAAE
jgi:hypothetical protein